MGVLPPERVKLDQVFQNSALDLMGPFKVKRFGRANHKVWICVFVCMASRAVHAEVTYTLEVASLINAIHRFIARRPGVKTFISDQGSNMKAAASILKSEMKRLNESARPELHKMGIEWTLIPVANPQRGGVWERMVGLFKKQMAVTISSAGPLQIDTFVTAVISIEATINRRPITTVSSDAFAPEPLSPAMLLNPGAASFSVTDIIPNTARTEGDDHRFRYKEALGLRNSFNSRFYKEYIALLATRAKWKTSSPNLPVGAVVIIVDLSIKRKDWCLGCIIETPQTDAHTRRFMIRKGSGEIIERDRSGIVHLECDEY